MTEAPFLELRGVAKRFGAVHALRGVDLELHRGEVLALVGENGAGKSTLMKVLAGIVRPDQGEVRFAGEVVRLSNTAAAIARGIALIHQELDLAENLDVAGNVFLGREPRRAGLLDHAALHGRTGALLKQLGADFSSSDRVSDLSIGRRQMVEIAKALSQKARVLIMDEPTSSLSHTETERLFSIVRKLRAEGVAIVYISHALGEVEALADRAVVLRDGASVGELPQEEIARHRLVELMVGRSIEVDRARAIRAAGDALLEIDGLVLPEGRGRKIDLRISAGEIVGLAGLVGAGRSELLRTIFGIDRPVAGAVRLEGRALAPGDVDGAIRAGLALVPEDRKAEGLLLDWTLSANLGLAAQGRLGKRFKLEHGRELAWANQAMLDLGIRASSERQRAGELSGGNQQKVVLGKWLALRPRVLLLDEPTRGVDVGARQELYYGLEELAKSGIGILFASSEMEEILTLADRVLVMRGHSIAGELARDGLSEEAVLQLATQEEAA